MCKAAQRRLQNFDALTGRRSAPARRRSGPSALVRGEIRRRANTWQKEGTLLRLMATPTPVSGKLGLWVLARWLGESIHPLTTATGGGQPDSGLAFPHTRTCPLASAGRGIAHERFLAEVVREVEATTPKASGQLRVVRIHQVVRVDY